MKSNRRWMKWVLEETAKETPDLPWTRSQKQRRREPAPKLRVVARA
ncbi:hypothetical protein [Actibacterium atlanticum]|nr:hypothetical protein [Actibacterium atlanticum]